MVNFGVEANRLLLGHLTDLFLAVEGYSENAIATKLQSNVYEDSLVPDVVTFYEDHILPRKEKKEFKWAGNIENLHAAPHNFVDDEPTAGAPPSTQVTSKPSWSDNPPNEPETHQ